VPNVRTWQIRSQILHLDEPGLHRWSTLLGAAPPAGRTPKLDATREPGAGAVLLPACCPNEATVESLEVPWNAVGESEKSGRSPRNASDPRGRFGIHPLQPRGWGVARLVRADPHRSTTAKGTFGRLTGPQVPFLGARGVGSATPMRSRASPWPRRPSAPPPSRSSRDPRWRPARKFGCRSVVFRGLDIGDPAAAASM